MKFLILILATLIMAGCYESGDHVKIIGDTTTYLVISPWPNWDDITLQTPDEYVYGSLKDIRVPAKQLLMVDNTGAIREKKEREAYTKSQFAFLPLLTLISWPAIVVAVVLTLLVTAIILPFKLGRKIVKTDWKKIPDVEKRKQLLEELKK
jgi:hypothetical protein